MDFKELLEPYAERDNENRPMRTTEGQIKWLTSKGFPRNIIDQAILRVYNELDTGLSFEPEEGLTAGHKLDRHLFDAAQDLHRTELSKQAEELEKFLNVFKQNAVEQYVKAQRGSVWKRMKAVFKP